MQQTFKKGKDGRFKPLGKGVGRGASVSIGSRWPADVAAVLKSLPNTQDYIRSAVVEKMKVDGLL